jgi:uncharacterized protein YjiS (DUF1127 family)
MNAAPYYKRNKIGIPVKLSYRACPISSMQSWLTGDSVTRRGKTKCRLEPSGERYVDCAWRTRLGFRRGSIMTMYETRYFSAAALFGIAAIMRAAARRVRAAAKWMDGWLERRRVAATAFHDLGTMSERELLDIGLSRADVNRVAWGASDRTHNPV